MPRRSTDTVAVLGIDIGKNTFHLIGLNERGAIILRLKLSRRQLEARLANLPPCLIGMEACVGAHHLSRRLTAVGHDARLMPAHYVRAYVKDNKNDFRDAEAIAEAVQRPTILFVATKTAEQLRPSGSAGNSEHELTKGGSRGTRKRTNKRPGDTGAGSRSAFVVPPTTGNRARRDPISCNAPLVHTLGHRRARCLSAPATSVHRVPTRPG